MVTNGGGNGLGRREKAERALIDAAAQLFAEHTPSSVSVRQIATRAGVNHGLVHHYFGSKAGLVNAVLEDLVDTMSTLDLAAVTGGESIDRARFVLRVIGRILLDSDDMASAQSRFPLAERMLAAGQQQFGLSEGDARVRTAQVMAMLLGWLLFEPWLVRAAGLPAEAAEGVRTRLPDAMLRLAVPLPPSD